jgi:hypothetical protein
MMKILDQNRFELPNIFARLSGWMQPPPSIADRDHRPVKEALAHPHFTVYDPAHLNFPHAQRPVVPGNGGYVTCGLGPIQYDHQPKFDRHAVYQSGPVREFFRAEQLDNRVKASF